ncbi:MAG: S8 family serine peptidase, partial [Flavobacteriaceae bacterium]|nr:S8 family serine peptidase [Flavobacteriaceae bacterium]
MKKTNYFLRLFLTFSFSSLLLLTSCQEEETILSVQEMETLANFDIAPIEGQYIVILKESSTGKYTDQKYDQRIASLKNEYLNRFSALNLASDQLKQTYGYSISGFAAKLSEEQLQSLRKDKRIKYIEQDYQITLSPDLSILRGKPGSGGGTTETQTTPWGINRVGGGESGTGKVAWIIDSGIDLTHPDLNVDVAQSRSFLSGRDADDPNDANGHGTHVAGTVAAIDNTIGVIGVAAGATVVAVRVLDRRGSGSYSGVIAGVEYVGAQGNTGDAANMSLGGPVSQALDDAVVAASSKVRFALAAGNESDDANNHSPARANGPNIYTISAMDSTDK